MRCNELFFASLYKKLFQLIDLLNEGLEENYQCEQGMRREVEHKYDMPEFQCPQISDIEEIVDELEGITEMYYPPALKRAKAEYKKEKQQCR